MATQRQSQCDTPRDVENCGCGSSDAAVDLGDLDVTFSAPFYTGVFLSSRELQGDYKYAPLEKKSEAPPRANVRLGMEKDYVCHQKIVIDEMKKKEKGVLWEWNFPLDVANFWDRTVSPSYFIGCSETTKSTEDMRKDNSTEVFNKIKDGISAVEEIDLYECGLMVKSFDVKFYEFAFGSVSIRLKVLKLPEDLVNSSENYKKFLNNCKEKARYVLNFIAKKATEAYRNSVPCCIKNSDIWDINNFDGLAADKNMCRVGEVQEISIVAVLEEKCQTYFKDKLASRFLNFAENLYDSPVNAAFQLFTDGQNVTIALESSKNENENSEIEQLLFANEMIMVSFAIEKYFKNFFYSYHNYMSTENELFESKDNIRWWNIWKLKNLIEKFSDVQSIYFQTKNFVLNYMLTSDHSLYMSKLYTIHPKINMPKSIFSVTDESINQLEKQCDQIKFAASQYWQISTSVLTVGISILIVAFLTPISLLLENLGLFRIIAIQVVILISLFASATLITAPWLKSRKLYYICRLQKKKYRKMFKDQERKNKDKNACVCKVKGCHRCRGEKWHSRVFYRDENLCFRCGINFVKWRKLFK